MLPISTSSVEPNRLAAAAAAASAAGDAAASHLLLANYLLQLKNTFPCVELLKFPSLHLSMARKEGNIHNSDKRSAKQL